MTFLEDFDFLLKDPLGLRLFTDYLQKEFSGENIKFWKACEEFKSLPAKKRLSAAKAIYDLHLQVEASEPVNVDPSARESVRQALLGCCNIQPDIFEKAQKEIYRLMKMDSFPRFLTSNMFVEYQELRNQRRPSKGGFGFLLGDKSRSKKSESGDDCAQRGRWLFPSLGGVRRARSSDFVQHAADSDEKSGASAVMTTSAREEDISPKPRAKKDTTPKSKGLIKVRSSPSPLVLLSPLGRRRRNNRGGAKAVAAADDAGHPLNSPEIIVVADNSTPSSEKQQQQHDRASTLNNNNNEVKLPQLVNLSPRITAKLFGNRRGKGAPHRGRAHHNINDAVLEGQQQQQPGYGGKIGKKEGLDRTLSSPDFISQQIQEQQERNNRDNHDNNNVKEGSGVARRSSSRRSEECKMPPAYLDNEMSEAGRVKSSSSLTTSGETSISNALADRLVLVK